jgi:hypothetical protein
MALDSGCADCLAVRAIPVAAVTDSSSTCSPRPFVVRSSTESGSTNACILSNDRVYFFDTAAAGEPAGPLDIEAHPCRFARVDLGAPPEVAAWSLDGSCCFVGDAKGRLHLLTPDGVSVSRKQLLRVPRTAAAEPHESTTVFLAIFCVGTLDHDEIVVVSRAGQVFLMRDMRLAELVDAVKNGDAGKLKSLKQAPSVIVLETSTLEHADGLLLTADANTSDRGTVVTLSFSSSVLCGWIVPSTAEAAACAPSRFHLSLLAPACVVAVDPSGALLATSDGRSVSVWSADTGGFHCHIDPMPKTPAAVSAMAWVSSASVAVDAQESVIGLAVAGTDEERRPVVTLYAIKDCDEAPALLEEPTQVRLCAPAGWIAEAVSLSPDEDDPLQDTVDEDGAPVVSRTGLPPRLLLHLRVRDVPADAVFSVVYALEPTPPAARLEALVAVHGQDAAVAYAADIGVDPLDVHRAHSSVLLRQLNSNDDASEEKSLAKALALSLSSIASGGDVEFVLGICRATRPILRSTAMKLVQYSSAVGGDKTLSDRWAAWELIEPDASSGKLPREEWGAFFENDWEEAVASLLRFGWVSQARTLWQNRPSASLARCLALAFPTLPPSVLPSVWGPWLHNDLQRHLTPPQRIQLECWLVDWVFRSQQLKLPLVETMCAAFALHPVPDDDVSSLWFRTGGLTPSSSVADCTWTSDDPLAGFLTAAALSGAGNALHSLTGHGTVDPACIDSTVSGLGATDIGERCFASWMLDAESGEVRSVPNLLSEALKAASEWSTALLRAESGLKAEVSVAASVTFAGLPPRMLPRLLPLLHDCWVLHRQHQLDKSLMDLASDSAAGVAVTMLDRVAEHDQLPDQVALHVRPWCRRHGLDCDNLLADYAKEIADAAAAARALGDAGCGSLEERAVATVLCISDSSMRAQAASQTAESAVLHSPADRLAAEALQWPCRRESRAALSREQQLIYLKHVVQVEGEILHEHAQEEDAGEESAESEESPFTRSILNERAAEALLRTVASRSISTWETDKHPWTDGGSLFGADVLCDAYPATLRRASVVLEVARSALFSPFAIGEAVQVFSRDAVSLGALVDRRVVAVVHAVLTSPLEAAEQVALLETVCVMALQHMEQSCDDELDASVWKSLQGHLAAGWAATRSLLEQSPSGMWQVPESTEPAEKRRLLRSALASDLPLQAAAFVCASGVATALCKFLSDPASWVERVHLSASHVSPHLAGWGTRVSIGAGIFGLSMPEQAQADGSSVEQQLLWGTGTSWALLNQSIALTKVSRLGDEASRHELLLASTAAYGVTCTDADDLLLHARTVADVLGEGRSGLRSALARVAALQGQSVLAVQWTRQLRATSAISQVAMGLSEQFLKPTSATPRIQMAASLRTLYAAELVSGSAESAVLHIADWQQADMLLGVCQRTELSTPVSCIGPADAPAQSEADMLVATLRGRIELARGAMHAPVNNPKQVSAESLAAAIFNDDDEEEEGKDSAARAAAAPSTPSRVAIRQSPISSPAPSASEASDDMLESELPRLNQRWYRESGMELDSGTVLDLAAAVVYELREARATLHPLIWATSPSVARGEASLRLCEFLASHGSILTAISVMGMSPCEHAEMTQTLARTAAQSALNAPVLDPLLAFAWLLALPLSDAAGVLRDEIREAAARVKGIELPEDTGQEMNHSEAVRTAWSVHGANADERAAQLIGPAVEGMPLVRIHDPRLEAVRNRQAALQRMCDIASVGVDVALMHDHPRFLTECCAVAGAAHWWARLAGVGVIINPKIWTVGSKSEKSLASSRVSIPSPLSPGSLPTMAGRVADTDPIDITPEAYRAAVALCLVTASQGSAGPSTCFCRAYSLPVSLPVVPHVSTLLTHPSCAGLEDIQCSTVRHLSQLPPSVAAAVVATSIDRMSPYDYSNLSFGCRLHSALAGDDGTLRRARAALALLDTAAAPRRVLPPAPHSLLAVTLACPALSAALLRSLDRVQEHSDADEFVRNDLLPKILLPFQRAKGSSTPLFVWMARRAALDCDLDSLPEAPTHPDLASLEEATVSLLSIPDSSSLRRVLAIAASRPGPHEPVAVEEEQALVSAFARTPVLPLRAAKYLVSQRCSHFALPTLLDRPIDVLTPHLTPRGIAHALPLAGGTDADADALTVALCRRMARAMVRQRLRASLARAGSRQWPVASAPGFAGAVSLLDIAACVRDASDPEARVEALSAVAQEIPLDYAELQSIAPELTDAIGDDEAIGWRHGRFGPLPVGLAAFLAEDSVAGMTAPCDARPPAVDEPSGLERMIDRLVLHDPPCLAAGAPTEALSSAFVNVEADQALWSSYTAASLEEVMLPYVAYCGDGFCLGGEGRHPLTSGVIDRACSFFHWVSSRPPRAVSSVHAAEGRCSLALLKLRTVGLAMWFACKWRDDVVASAGGERAAAREGGELSDSLRSASLHVRQLRATRVALESRVDLLKLGPEDYESVQFLIGRVMGEPLEDPSIDDSSVRTEAATVHSRPESAAVRLAHSIELRLGSAGRSETRSEEEEDLRRLLDDIVPHPVALVAFLLARATEREREASPIPAVTLKTLATRTAWRHSVNLKAVRSFLAEELLTAPGVEPSPRSALVTVTRAASGAVGLVPSFLACARHERVCESRLCSLLKVLPGHVAQTPRPVMATRDSEALRQESALAASEAAEALVTTLHHVTWLLRYGLVEELPRSVSATDAPLVRSRALRTALRLAPPELLSSLLLRVRSECPGVDLPASLAELSTHAWGLWTEWIALHLRVRVNARQLTNETVASGVARGLWKDKRGDASSTLLVGLILADSGVNDSSMWAEVVQSLVDCGHAADALSLVSRAAITGSIRPQSGKTSPWAIALQGAVSMVQAVARSSESSEHDDVLSRAVDAVASALTTQPLGDSTASKAAAQAVADLTSVRPSVSLFTSVAVSVSLRAALLSTAPPLLRVPLFHALSLTTEQTAVDHLSRLVDPAELSKAADAVALRVFLSSLARQDVTLTPAVLHPLARGLLARNRADLLTIVANQLYPDEDSPVSVLLSRIAK